MRGLEESTALVKRGVAIAREAAKHGDPEAKLLVHHLRELSRNSKQIITLEESLGVKPRDSWQGLFIRKWSDVFRIIGRSNRLFRKGEGVIFIPDLWKEVLDLKKLSVQRRQQLGIIKRQNKRAIKLKVEQKKQRAAVRAMRRK